MRSINQKGVEHVMRLFLLHYGSKKLNNSFKDELMKQNILFGSVLCDEEALSKNN